MNASEWIDRVRKAKGLPSDYAAAHALGITRQAISKYRSRDSTLDDHVSLKVAQLLDLDPAIVLTDQAMERAKDADTRGAWSAILQRLGGVAAGVLVAVGFGGTPAPASASAGNFMTMADTVHYVKRRRRSVMGSMARALQGRQVPA